MAGVDRSKDNDLLIALKHPLRREILRKMVGEEAISPRQMADALDHPLANVSYHVRVLHECAAIHLVREKPKGGSVQHFYCAEIETPWVLEVLGLDNGNGGEPGESSTDPGT
jgi:DNA-binding transcriptional ArsR family regulator